VVRNVTGTKGVEETGANETLPRWYAMLVGPRAIWPNSARRQQAKGTSSDSRCSGQWNTSQQVWSIPPTTHRGPVEAPSLAGRHHSSASANQ